MRVPTRSYTDSDQWKAEIELIFKRVPLMLAFTAERPDPGDFNAVIRDAIDLREQCGDGVLPLAAMFETFPAGIPLSIELRSLALREAFPHPALRAAEVARATRAWMEAHT